MDPNLKAAGMKRLEQAAAALKKNGFDAEVFAGAAPAAKAVLALIGKNKKIGLGGSMTTAELGLPEALKKAGNTIITHTPEMSDAERIKTWLKAQAADFYIASPQAVTAKGEMIFVDGLGNRTAAVLYGPGKVILLAGVNKLVGDTDEGLRRMRNVAAIANNFRLGKDNPCVKSGKCEDCASPARICNAVLMLWKKPRLTNYKVMLINEALGY
jgi:hypothetical protein